MVASLTVRASVTWPPRDRGLSSIRHLKYVRDLTISRNVNLRRAKDSRPEPDISEPVPGDGTPDAALDAVAAILRVLADTAVRDPDAAGRLQAWARHILVLTAPPGARESSPAGRDWRGLSSHVVAHVRDERAAASSSIGDLQDAVWLVIEGLSQAIVGDAAADASAANQLDRLRAAAGGSAAELKATALETVQALSEIIDEKRTRQLQLARELGERVDILKVELEDTRREADIDPVTQLWNRGVFQRELPRAVQVRTLTDEPACLVMVDIDHFKQVNDAHGHTTGDTALEVIASALVRSFPRRSDVVTRFGGDEFAVILRDADAADGARLADRFVAAVRDLELAGPRDAVKVTVSAGVAASLPGEPADRWLARADRALYEAKAGGRDRVAIADERSAGQYQVAAA